MLYGGPPFYHEDAEKLYKKILNSSIVFPLKKKVSDHAKHFMLMLLRHSIAMRLGSRGTKEVMECSWLADVDFQKVRNKEIIPEFKPASSYSSTSNFDDIFTRLNASDSISQSTMSKEGALTTAFPGFDYAFDTV
jgi:hypothetical protein